ncbi:MAG: hypothetical protein QOJ35_747 [Solirubrobacteraceae bacterium]|jgi:hypothetical protein|nr:hypothetical protein [Solirubrobacteraceae bacterium]
MVGLAALALVNSVVNWGRAPVIASRLVAADAATLSSLVADPACQWRLVDGVSPLLRPHAQVAPSANPRFVHARVLLGRRDVLWITWILTPRRGTTEVDLAGQLQSHAILARLVLMAGGRRWLRHRLDATLGTLAALAVRAAEDLDDAERHAAPPAPSIDRTPTQGAT